MSFNKTFTASAELVPNTEFKFKLCLIGDGGTGKTTFITKILNGNFTPKYEATIGAVTREVTFYLGNNSSVKYEIWDTAGQEKHYNLKEGYYIGAHAGFFFYDVTSRESLSRIPEHIQRFRNACGCSNPKIYIIANKVDLLRNRNHAETVLRMKEKYDGLIHISAKTNYRYTEPFETLTKALFNNPELIISANLDLAPVDPELVKKAIYMQAPELAESLSDFVPDQ